MRAGLCQGPWQAAEGKAVQMTAKIQILSNTNYPLSDVLKSELIESTKVQIAVAFLQRTGIDEIYKSLDYALLALKDSENKRKNMKVVEKTAAITRRCMKKYTNLWKIFSAALAFFLFL
jgi:HKD family nuclease